MCCFFFQAEDGIRDLVRSRGLGDVYKRQGSYLDDMEVYDSAIVYFKKSIELDKNNAVAYSNIGVAFIQLERLDSAIVYCRQAVNLAPKYENAIINLGLAFHANGQYDSSINYFLKAIQIEPTRGCLLYTSPSPRDRTRSRMPSSA